ncbi:Protein phosphatase 1 regulatory inhibitor subunit 16B [Orchesella cincta]|uniref:Protein phosphatase 1 regulatory inhibitor subunit 16B n=1 Tax=Orchesella cincta TaxID=48709 RepID=A0A1D2MY42_ORCCI|nr:Protein phosphatase 1 regulatory inhibitor subunit 16B [Orchesella cincta]
MRLIRSHSSFSANCPDSNSCCIDDNEEMMKILLDYGANVNAEDSEKWTPLHAAATCGHLHLVQYLIAKGANLLAVNAEGNMPYDICDDETTLDYIESEMAKRGVTQELIEEIRALPETRMLQEVQRIHAQGGDLEVRDADGATPLHIASANGYYRVAEFLLDNHVATDVQDKDFWQPIHAAACWGHLDVLELLVQNGADLDARTKNNETPYAICEDPEIKERIIQLRTEQQTKRANEGRKRPSRTHSTNSRTQSIRRTSQRDKGLTSKRDAADEAQMLRAREEHHKENSPSPTGDTTGGGSTNKSSTVAVNGNGAMNGSAGHNTQNGNTSSEEDHEDKSLPPSILGRDSVGKMKMKSDEMNRLQEIAVKSGATNHNNHHQLNNQISPTNNGSNAIKMNNLRYNENGSLQKNQNNIHKNLNNSSGSGASGNSPVSVLASPVPDDNGNLLPKPEINPSVDNKVPLGGLGSGVSLSGSRDNLVGLSSSAGNSTIDIHVSVTINTNSPVSTLTNGESGHGNSHNNMPISPGSTIFTPPGTLSDLKKQRSLIRTSSNPLTNGGMNDSMKQYHHPPASPTMSLRRFVGDPAETVGDYGDGGKRCCVIV